MSKVFMVGYKDSSSWHALGVFSTREKAEAAMKLRPDLHPDRERSKYDKSEWDEVAEWEIDSTEFIIQPGAEMKWVHVATVDTLEGTFTDDQKPRFFTIEKAMLGRTNFAMLSKCGRSIQAVSLIDAEDARACAERARDIVLAYDGYVDVAKQNRESEKTRAAEGTLVVLWYEYALYILEDAR